MVFRKETNIGDETTGSIQLANDFYKPLVHLNRTVDGAYPEGGLLTGS